MGIRYGDWLQTGLLAGVLLAEGTFGFEREEFRFSLSCGRDDDLWRGFGETASSGLAADLFLTGGDCSLEDMLNFERTWKVEGEGAAVEPGKE